MIKYWNNQKFSECQLVTLWNAAMYHGLTVPKRYGVEYVKDCIDACAINGSALYTRHVIEALGLRSVPGRLNFGWNWMKTSLPVELSIHCHRGFHSVLVVDLDLGRRSVLLANYARDRLHWMSFSEVKEKQNKRRRPIRWRKSGAQ